MPNCEVAGGAESFVSVWETIESFRGWVGLGLGLASGLEIISVNWNVILLKFRSRDGEPDTTSVLGII